VSRSRLGQAFLEHYLEPMAAAVWSTGTAPILAFPALTFARFFHNHGFLDLRNRPTWRVIEGGSSRYVAVLTRTFADRIRLDSPIERVVRDPTCVRVTPINAATETFDHVVIATHSDQALRMLGDPTAAERSVLGAIGYTQNDVQLHTDTRLLPRTPRARASWNAHVAGRDQRRVLLTYDQSRLQSLNARRRYLVTLNRADVVDRSQVIRDLTYAHPLFDLTAVAAQGRHEELNGQQRTYFCGAYWGYGFHEDGVNSALVVARQFGQVLA
jgi:predicted NAD/FAD-binding protein